METACRAKHFEFLPECLMKLGELRAMMEDLCKQIGIKPVTPVLEATGSSASSSASGQCAPAAKRAKIPLSTDDFPVD